MTLKKLLGAESSPLSDLEIMRMLEDAYHHNLRTIEIPGRGGKPVCITIKGINVEGIMKEYESS